MDSEEAAFVPYLSKEKQRQRIIELVEQEKGEKCPELVVEYTTKALGGGQAFYRRSQDAADLEELKLNPKQAEYVGLDIMRMRERPEADGTGRRA